MIPITIPNTLKAGIHRSLGWIICANFLIITATLAPIATGVAVAESDREFNELIARLQPELKRGVTELDIMYWPSLLNKFPDLKYAIENAPRFKEAAVSLLAEGNGGENDTSEAIPLVKRSPLIISCMYGLAPDAYLTFVEDVGKQANAGKIRLSDDDYIALLFPKHNLEGFFEYNFKEPKVRVVLEELRRLRTASDRRSVRNIPSTIDSILDGKMAEGRSASRWRYPNEYPNSLEPPLLTDRRATLWWIIGAILASGTILFALIAKILHKRNEINGSP